MSKLDKTVQAFFKDETIQPNIIAYVFKLQINDDKEITDYINLSAIFSTLIQETGRFAEYYAADLLIGIDSFKKDAVALLHSKPQTTVSCNAYFGIRQHGVDSECFLDTRLSEAAEQHNYFKFQNLYRRIYAIHMNIVPDEDSYLISVYLLNITKDCKLDIFAEKEDKS